MCDCAVTCIALPAGAPASHPSLPGNSSAAAKAGEASPDHCVGQPGSSLLGTAAGHPGHSLSHSPAQRQGGASGRYPPVYVSPFPGAHALFAHDSGAIPGVVCCPKRPDLMKLCLMVSESIWAEQVLPTTSMPAPCYRLDWADLCGVPIYPLESHVFDLWLQGCPHGAAVPAQVGAAEACSGQSCPHLPHPVSAAIGGLRLFL